MESGKSCRRLSTNQREVTILTWVFGFSSLESGRGLPASRVAAPRAGVAVDGDDDADIAAYNMVVLEVRRRSGGGIWACV